MTHRFNAVDKERDRETLHATTTLRKAMEGVEFNFFARGIGTWDDVTTARDEYIEAWEERRNFVLSEKNGYSPQALAAVIAEAEAANRA